MVNMIALDSFFGDYVGGAADGVRAGLIHKGESFLASEENALMLESRGLAMRAFIPRVTPAWNPETYKPKYQTKVVVPELSNDQRIAAALHEFATADVSEPEPRKRK
jgi:hypothetical protein